MERHLVRDELQVDFICDVGLAVALNTRWAIILPGAFAPFSVFLLTKSMRRIPASLIEVAMAKASPTSLVLMVERYTLKGCRSALGSRIMGCSTMFQ